MKVYNVMGIMSGTSLDGLDICYCTFSISTDQQWNFEIKNTDTISFPTSIKNKLSNAITFNGLELALLHNEFGNFTGQAVNNFIAHHRLNKNDIHAISSHGHTIFHQPENKLTLQIGNGANISSITQLPVVCDFRTGDMSLAGQGAPLVPIGDQLLFSEYDNCLNLGGIANISFQTQQRIAFDICPANIVLNKLANTLGQDYDNKGEMAKSGSLNTSLLKELNALDYYKTPYPKSLGIEWIEQTIFPILASSNISTEDKLNTFTQHISIQIANHLTEGSTTLVTGGGAYNSFLIERIKTNSNSRIILPKKHIIDFKEALIFAFLGILRIRQETNVLKSVTGASTNNIGGCIYQSL